MTMKEEAMVVGIDVSKQHLDVGLHPVGLVRRVGNDHDGLTEAVDWLSGHAVALVVMEAIISDMEDPLSPGCCIILCFQIFELFDPLQI